MQCIIAKQSALAKPYLWKFLFSASAQCQVISSLSTYAFGQLKLSDADYFFIGFDASTNDLHFYKVTFGNTAVGWTNKMLLLNLYIDSIIISLALIIKKFI